jgi:poly(A) polymerase
MRFRYTTGKNGKLVKAALVYTQDEHGIELESVDKDAVYIIRRLRASGFESYIVGGAVRDLILRKRPKDFDIVSSATPIQIKRLFRNARIIGKRFRLVHVFFGQTVYEVSTFRSLKDGLTGNVFGTITEDARRRDFSLNALYYDPLEEVVVDYTGGMKDMKQRLIKPVIPLNVIFIDDPVRMIRALKYAAATGFTMPWELRRRIKHDASLLQAVSPSRLTEEMLKIIKNPHPAEIVKNLFDYGLYPFLQSGAASLMAMNADFRSRYLKTLSELGKKNEGSAELPLADMLTALIRDYVEDPSCNPAAEWKAENYTTVFMSIRSFVRPMNPSRIGLDRALRQIYAEHGCKIIRTRVIGARAENLILSENNTIIKSEEAPKRKRKSRRRKRSNSTAPVQAVS